MASEIVNREIHARYGSKISEVAALSCLPNLGSVVNYSLEGGGRSIPTSVGCEMGKPVALRGNPTLPREQAVQLSRFQKQQTREETLRAKGGLQPNQL